MAEPDNLYEVGKFHSSIGFGKGVHRIITHTQALDLAYWLIKEADRDTPGTHAALQRILNLLMERARGERTQNV